MTTRLTLAVSKVSWNDIPRNAPRGLCINILLKNCSYITAALCVAQAAAYGVGVFPQQHNAVRALPAALLRRRSAEDDGDTAGGGNRRDDEKRNADQTDSEAERRNEDSLQTDEVPHMRFTAIFFLVSS